MRVFRILSAILITLLLYVLISLISIHYLNYFVPELDLFNLSRNDIVGSIAIIDTIETIIAIVLIIVLYYLCFKIYTIKSYKPFLAIFSNLLLVLIGVVYLLYWETEFFYVQKTIEYGTYKGETYFDHSDDSYDIFKWFIFLCILTSILFNIHFLSSIVSKNRKNNYLILAFIPISSLLFLKFGSFLNSKEVIWIKNRDNEDRINPKDFLNLDLDDNTPIWYKGLDKWITYRDYKSRTPLSMIK